jgi:hypothetical protein
MPGFSILLVALGLLSLDLIGKRLVSMFDERTFRKIHAKVARYPHLYILFGRVRTLSLPVQLKGEKND